MRASLAASSGPETRADPQRPADRHGESPKPAAPSDERAEAEGDQQGLDAAVARDAGQLFLQHGKLAGFHTEIVNENRIQNNPANREEAT